MILKNIEHINTTILESTDSPKKIMLFELSVGGHYPEYISHLIDYWCDRNILGWLNIVVSPLFVKRHGKIQKQVELATNTSNIFLTTIANKEYERLKPFNNGINRNLRAWQELSLAKKYVKKLNPTHVFFPYFDTRQLPLIVGNSLNCSYSGIYFRPSFHYQFFERYESSWRDKLQHWREKLILSLVLKDSQLKNLFCLDPYAIKHINQINSDRKAKYLPDPVKEYSNPVSNLAKLKSSLMIDPSRQVHLLFGGLGKRKGLDKLLDSLALLPTFLCQKLCILILGAMTEECEQQTFNTIKQLESSLPIQIIVRNQYIPEREIQDYFQIADVILAPYQHHVGMSGIINRAAAAGKPVLASDYGLMGEITRRYKLGLAIDSTNTKAITQGLTQFLTNSPDRYSDFNLMREFALKNSPENFADTIFNSI